MLVWRWGGGAACLCRVTCCTCRVAALDRSFSVVLSRVVRRWPAEPSASTMNSKFFATGDSSSDSDDRSSALTFCSTRREGVGGRGEGSDPCVFFHRLGVGRGGLLGGCVLRCARALGRRTRMLTVCWLCVFLVCCCLHFAALRRYPCFYLCLLSVFAARVCVLRLNAFLLTAAPPGCLYFPPSRPAQSRAAMRSRSRPSPRP